MGISQLCHNSLLSPVSQSANKSPVGTDSPSLRQWSQQEHLAPSPSLAVLAMQGLSPHDPTT